MINIPVKFRDKVTTAPSANGTGYPYKISANDLDRNFIYAALDAEDGWIEDTSVGNYEGRKLKLPAIPSGEETFVLGCAGGKLQWIATAGCE